MSQPVLSAGPAADTSQSVPSQEAPSSQSVGAESSQQQSGDSGNSGNGFNPAWNSLLEKLPTEFHNIIAPDLRQWDDNFRTRTQEVQSQYEPYKFLLDGQIDPEQVQTALSIAALIESDPRAFHERMGEFYKDQWGQGQEVSEGNDPAEEATFSLDGSDDDITKHPKFQELLSNQDAMAQYLAQQIQQQQEAEQNAKLDADLTRLRDKYGDFDEDFVLAYTMQKQVDLEDAVKAYSALTEKIRTAPRANDTAPAVFSPSGGVPSSQVNPGQLSDKDTRNLVVEFLARSQQG